VEWDFGYSDSLYKWLREQEAREEQRGWAHETFKYQKAPVPLLRLSYGTLRELRAFSCTEPLNIRVLWTPLYHCCMGIEVYAQYELLLTL